MTIAPYRREAGTEGTAGTRGWGGLTWMAGRLTGPSPVGHQVETPPWRAWRRSTVRGMETAAAMAVVKAVAAVVMGAAAGAGGGAQR